MSLSCKHYEAVALELREEQDGLDRFPDAGYSYRVSELNRLTERLCRYFQSDNPAFDPARFRKAAQP